MSKVDASEIANTARGLLRLHAVEQPVLLAAYTADRLAIWLGYEVMDDNDASARPQGEIVALGVLEIIEFPYAYDECGWDNARAAMWLTHMSPASSKLGGKVKGPSGAWREVKMATFMEGRPEVSPRVWVTWPDGTRSDGLFTLVKKERSW